MLSLLNPQPVGARSAPVLPFVVPRPRITAPTQPPCRLGALGAALCLALWPSLTWAQQDWDAETLLGLSLQELIETPVVTASRQVQTRDQTPAHIAVITREQIRARRYQNLADLLEDLPGVDFQRGTKTSQFHQFTVQGHLGPNRLLVLLDGVRIGHPGGGNFPVADNLSLHHASQVEVLYGPAAALYGADAVAGVVNIITEAGNAKDGSWVSLGGGNFGTRQAAFMTGTETSQGLKLAAGGHAQRSDRAPLDAHYPDYFVPVPGIFGGQTVLPGDAREPYASGSRSHSLFARLDWQQGLTLGLYRYRFQNLTSNGDPYATTRYDPSAQWQTTTDTLYGRYRFTLGENVQAQLQVDYARMEVDPKANYNNIYNGFTPGYSYVWGERTNIEQTLSWQLDERHQMQAGLGWQSFYDIEAGSLPQRYDPAQSPTGQGMVYPNTNLPLVPLDASFRNLSAYAQWQAQWSADLSTMAGLRVDRHSAYGTSVNPRLGVVWKPRSEHVFKALYGQAFRAPSPEESLSTYGSFDGSQDAEGRYIGSDFRIANPNLTPEKVRSLSLVWDWRPSDNLNIVSNLYHSRITNLVITRDLDTITTPTAQLHYVSMKDNAGQQQQTGLDVSAQWRFHLSPQWSGELWGSASWVRGRVDSGDGVDWRIPYVARRKLKLGTTLRWRDQFSITPKLRWIGATTNGRTKPPADALLPPARCHSAQTAPSRCTSPGYAVVDLHLGWHKLLGGRASLWLDVYNLLDKRYYAAAGSGSRTFWDMPQQPRTWVVTVDYRF